MKLKTFTSCHTVEVIIRYCIFHGKIEMDGSLGRDILLTPDKCRLFRLFYKQIAVPFLVSLTKP